jgi:hypothetical protein
VDGDWTSARSNKPRGLAGLSFTSSISYTANSTTSRRAGESTSCLNEQIEKVVDELDEVHD